MPNLYSRFQTTSRAFIELSYFTAAQAANPERRFIKLVQVNTYAVVCVCVCLFPYMDGFSFAWSVAVQCLYTYIWKVKNAYSPLRSRVVQRRIIRENAK